MLSLGEQQRLAFLRLLLHEPSMAFLDEATGALDNATEASCYKALQKHSTSFVSVGKLCIFHMSCTVKHCCRHVQSNGLHYSGHLLGVLLLVTQ